ncbi:MAG: PKD domain-containing protein, partial [Firmicutes bacterium]|nr:PKD domain-containing protein [Bacillota bacterium]
VMIAAIAFTSSGDDEANVVYIEDFSQGSDLSALGFERPLYWEIDSIHGFMRTVSPGGRSATAEVYSPLFAADRTAGTVIVEWKANFLPTHHDPFRRGDDRLWVSLADEEGGPLYSLLFFPRRRLDRRADFDVELSKTVEGRPNVLARARTRAITPTGRWLGFRLMFHPPVANGGDGNIVFFYDIGDGRGYIEHIRVADETHLRFSRLHFKYKTGTGAANHQVAIDDLAVRLIADQNRPVETSAELLANPGFEDGLKGWHASPGWSTTGRAGHSGGRAAECAAHGPGWLAQGWGSGKLSIAGRHYLASVWMRADGHLEASLGLRWKDAYGNWIETDEYVVRLQPTDEWEQVTIEGEAPLGATQVWLHIERDRGRLLIDDCSLVERHPHNLLENPGFEAGAAAWSASPGWSFVSGEAYTGLLAARASLVDGEEATLVQGRSLSPLSEGMEFMASGWFKSTATARVRLALEWSDEEGTILNTDSTTLVLDPDKWQQLDLLGMAPAGAANLRLIAKAEGTGELLADGFRLEERVRPNLLHNPGFERGPFFWRVMGPWRVDEKTAASGARSLRLEIPFSGSSYYIRQGCEFGREIGGLRFLCSARIKTESVAGVALKPCWQNRAGNWLVDEASQVTLHTLQGTNDWTELRLAYTAPPGAVGVGLVVMPEKGDGRGTVWVDDCAVEPLATLTIGAAPGERPYTMAFNARLDLPGAITAYQWDFDGDGTADSDGPAPIHLFPGPGAYRCRLLATSADGSIYWTERTVTVLPVLAIEVTWRGLPPPRDHRFRCRSYLDYLGLRRRHQLHRARERDRPRLPGRRKIHRTGHRLRLLRQYRRNHN